jgi:hypothetical protein
MVAVRRTQKDKIRKGSINYEVAAGVNIIFCENVCDNSEKLRKW